MGSLRANPVLVGCLSYEYLFVLNHRLREQTQLAKEKKTEIFAEGVDSIFNQLFVQSIFTEGRAYSEEAVRQIFFEASQSPSLRISEESFAKFFGIMSMTFKAHILRVHTKADLISLISNQTLELRRVLKQFKDKVSVSIITDYRIKLIDWFREMTYGEFSRLRQTLVNATRTYRTAVTLLVDSKLQATSGNLVLPIGSKLSSKLGHCVLFDGDGTEVVTYDLPVAGRNLNDPEYILGENMFKKKVMELGKSKAEREEEFQAKIAEIYSDTEEEMMYTDGLVAGGIDEKKVKDKEVDEDLADRIDRTAVDAKKKKKKKKKKEKQETDGETGGDAPANAFDAEPEPTGDAAKDALLSALRASRARHQS